MEKKDNSTDPIVELAVELAYEAGKAVVIFYLVVIVLALLLGGGAIALVWHFAAA